MKQVLTYLMFLLVLLVGVPNSGQADWATGLVFGLPARLGVRGVWQQTDGRWGANLDLAYPSITVKSQSAGTSGAETGTTERMLVVQSHARFLNSLNPFRTYEFAGFSMLSGPYGIGGKSGTYFGFSFGAGVEIRWLPGVGFSLDLGAVAPLSDLGQEIKTMGWGPLVAGGVVVWF